MSKGRRIRRSRQKTYQLGWVRKPSTCPVCGEPGFPDLPMAHMTPGNGIWRHPGRDCPCWKDPYSSRTSRTKREDS